MSRRTLATRSRAADTGPALSAPRPTMTAPIRSGGQSLDQSTQTQMSARFGHDFSQVRIHTDSRAEEAADALGADAYAVGGDIAFGEGQYTPGSPHTERLLAHELTHVVQQARFGPGDPDRASRRSDASEREAESSVDLVLAGQDVQVGAAPAAGVSRFGLDDYNANPMPDMPDHPLRWGNQPADKSVSGPYAYSNFDPPKPGDYIPGVAGGFGLFHGRGDIGGVPVGDDLGAASLNYGSMHDDAGNTRYGAKASGAVAALDFNKGGAVSGDAQAFNAGAEATFGDDGATLGATANIVGASVTTQDEHQTSRIGLSAGVGAAGRAYWGQGKDGFRNYGGGFDFGPLSVDLKTNDPLRTGIGLIPGVGGIAQQFLPKGNMTEDAANMVGLSTKNADLGTTWDVAKSAAGGAYDAAAGTASSVYNGVAGAASDAYSAGSQAVSDAGSAVTGAASDVYNAGSQAVSSAASTVSDTASSAYGWLSNAASSIDPSSLLN